MYNLHQDDEDDEVALRLAALKTLRRKDVPAPKPTPNTFLRNNKYPNLITIVPVVETPPVPLAPALAQPLQRRVSSPLNASLDEIAAKLIPQQQLSKPVVKKELPDEEQEVSTKFTRLEETESESEDDSDLDKKNSRSSDDSDDECLDLDDDDSLEALMAQMEQEFQTEPGSEVKKEARNRRKQKNNKDKDKPKENDKPKVSDKPKESDKFKEIDKLKECDKPEERDKPRESKECDKPKEYDRPKGNNKVINNKQEENESKFVEVKKAAVVEPNVKEISKEPVTITTVSVESTEDNFRDKRKSPPQEIPSLKNYVKLRSRSRSRSRSPVSLRNSPRRISPVRRKSPVWTTRGRSPSKSPARSLTPVRNSPRKFISGRMSQERFSPVRKLSPARSKKSASPYSRDKYYSYSHKTSRTPSPPRKRSVSPLPRMDRSRSRSPYYGSRSPIRTHRSRRSVTPVTNSWNSKSSRLSSPSYRQYSRSPVGRRSVSPRGRKFSRSPSPRYISNFVPRRRLSPRRKISPQLKSPASPDRRSLSPQSKRSLSPRVRRSVSPRRRDYSPRRRDLGVKLDAVPSKRNSPISRRNPVSPENNYRRYNSPHTPVRKEKSLSPYRSTPPPRRRSPLPQRQECQEQSRNKSGYQKEEVISKRKSWSRSPSLSLSPSPPPPKDRNGATDISSRRYKSPLRMRKSNADAGFYSKGTSSRRPASPDSKAVTNDVRDRRRNRNWERRTWEVRRVEKRRERNPNDNNKKDEAKIEKEVSPLLKITDNPVLEARRKKFESNDLVEPTSKKIRLKKEVSPVKEKKVENSVQTDDNLFDRRCKTIEEKLEYNESSGADSFEKLCNVEEDVLDLSAEVWSSDEDDFVSKPNGKNIGIRKVIRSATPPVPKRRSVKERINLKNKVIEQRLKPVSVTASTSTEVKHVDMLDKALSPLTVVQKADKETDAVKTPDASPAETDVVKVVSKDDVDSDLRAELSRRRAERLTKAGSVHESLPARLLQNAFEGVGVGKKKNSRIEAKEKSVKVKKVTSSPSPQITPPKEKSDGRRVLLLKRPSHAVRIPPSINVTIAEEPQDGSDSQDDNEESNSEKYRTQRKLPIYMRLGISDEQRHRPPRKGRKVKVKHRNQLKANFHWRSQPFISCNFELRKR